MKQGLPESKKESTQEKMTDGMTQHEVAEVMQISRSQVDTIEKKALRKLRYLLKLKFEKGDLL